MTRFLTCTATILLSTLTGHLCLFAAPATGGATTAQRPNILIYIADDMSWSHTSIGGDPAVKTPNFDQLAKAGVRFTHAFCSSPSCTPSRGALLTGQAFCRLEEGASLLSTLPAKFPVYPDLLEQAGYEVGFAGKGWDPGDWRPGGRKRNPAGPPFRSLRAFLQKLPPGKPFCFWVGSKDPHRAYEAGSGVASGIDPAKVIVPPIVPDTPEIRRDLADYLFEVQRFDSDLGGLLADLDRAGLRQNTLIAVTSDNGMPYPRGKCSLYDWGTREPLAIAWTGKIPPSRVIDDFVSLTDLAPTFLEAAGVPRPAEMTGRSLLPTLLSERSGRVERDRDRVFVGRERHDSYRLENGQPVGYPMRALRTEKHLYIRNFKPERFPCGDDPSKNQDNDRGPAKTYVATHKDDPATKPFYDRAYGRRPAEELYDLAKDPGQLRNLAGEAAYAQTRAQLRAELDGRMTELKDPRRPNAPDPDVFDRYPIHQRPRGELAPTNYLSYVTNCLDTLIAFGTDHYGPKTAPILVSILDVETRQCPSNPAALDEQWRVARRERRNPAGANLLFDQQTIKTLYAVSQVTGQARYARFADNYLSWYLTNLVDEKGFLWWGWHRHYDVFRDEKLGHLGNPHELHAIHCIAWDRLWAANPAAVRREIEAIWQWHVIDKQTGEVNRHGDGQRGCDFAMSAGACIEAFAFLYTQTHETVWLDRAKLLARYYRDRRDPVTGLFSDRPNAGSSRFDGSHFVTADTGLYCHSLLKTYELTGEEVFRDDALAYLKAYRRYGYDPGKAQFWGSLNLNGTPVSGPRVVPEKVRAEDSYQVYEPRGHLDLWQPYVAGYEHPLATAQVYVYAAQWTRDDAMLDTAKLFAQLIETNLPPRACLSQTWYRGYAEQYAPRGTYAGLYGQTISFFIHLHLLTADPHYLAVARQTADEAIARLYYQGLFRGHPAKPYYEAVDGVGSLLYALLQLDLTLRQPQSALAAKALHLGHPSDSQRLATDNW